MTSVIGNLSGNVVFMRGVDRLTTDVKERKVLTPLFDCIFRTLRRVYVNDMRTPTQCSGSVGTDTKTVGGGVEGRVGRDLGRIVVPFFRLFD